MPPPTPIGPPTGPYVAAAPPPGVAVPGTSVSLPTGSAVAALAAIVIACVCLWRWRRRRRGRRLHRRKRPRTRQRGASWQESMDGSENASSDCSDTPAPHRASGRSKSGAPPLKRRRPAGGGAARAAGRATRTERSRPTSGAPGARRKNGDASRRGVESASRPQRKSAAARRKRGEREKNVKSMDERQRVRGTSQAPPSHDAASAL